MRTFIARDEVNVVGCFGGLSPAEVSLANREVTGAKIWYKQGTNRQLIHFQTDFKGFFLIRKQTGGQEVAAI